MYNRNQSASLTTRILNSLPDKIDKADLTQRIESTRKIIEEDIAIYLNDRMVTLIDINAKENEFIKRAFKGRGSWLVFVKNTMPRVLSKLDLISKRIDRTFAREVYKDGLTLRQSYILTSLSSIEMISRLTSSIVFQAIYNNVTEKGIDVAPPSPANIKYVKDNVVSYFQLLEIYAKRDNEFERAIDSVRDDVIAANIEETDNIAAYQQDPLMMNFIATEWNPIFMVGKRIAAWQHARYLKRKEEKLSVELQLDALSGGSDDPAIARQIDYMQKRINKLQKSITDYEEEIRNA